MFTRPLYLLLTRIPKGKVTTYKALGECLGLHPRQVASLLSKNHEQDAFSCYKVVNSNGRLGGYNLGIEEKIRRLERDGIVIKDGRIEREYFWKIPQ